MDGSRNIWLTKAPEACRGVGISLHRKLEEILEVRTGAGARGASTETSCGTSGSLICGAGLLVGGGSCDFDAYIYEPLYARLCALRVR